MQHRMARGIAGLALVALGACGGDDTAAQGGAGGAGNEGGGLPQGQKPRQEPPAFVVGGFKASIPPQTLMPGEETFPCLIMPLDLTGPSHVVGGGKLTVTKGVHHGNVTARPKTGEGVRECPPDESLVAGEAADILAGGSVLFGSTTQIEGTEWRTFPDGMGYPIGDDWEIVFRMHYLNPTDQPIESTADYEWFTIDESKITHLLGPFIWRYADFELPPHAESTVTTTCTLPAETSLVDMMPHMHKLATNFSAEVVGGAHDGDTIIDSPGFNPDGLIESYEPALTLPAGQNFSFSCTWNNTFDKVITEGVGDNEMCMLFGYAYPYEQSFTALATPGGACLLVGLPPRQ